MAFKPAAPELEKECHYDRKGQNVVWALLVILAVVVLGALYYVRGRRPA